MLNNRILKLILYSLGIAAIVYVGLAFLMSITYDGISFTQALTSKALLGFFGVDFALNIFLFRNRIE